MTGKEEGKGDKILNVSVMCLKCGGMMRAIGQEVEDLPPKGSYAYKILNSPDSQNNDYFRCDACDFTIVIELKMRWGT